MHIRPPNSSSTRDISLDIIDDEQKTQRLIAEWRHCCILPTSDISWPHHLMTLQHAASIHLQAKENKPRFCAVYLDQKLAYILPVCNQQIRWLGMNLNLLGLTRHPHSPFTDVIPVTANQSLIEQTLKEVLQRLTQHYDCFVVQASPAMSHIVQFLQRTDSRCVMSPAGHCDTIDLRDRESSSSGLSKNFRANLRKTRERIGKLNQLEEHVSRDPDLLPDLYNRFLAVEGSGWKGASGKGSAIGLHENLRAFYSNLAQDGDDLYQCEISILEHEGRAISGQYSLIIGDRYYLLKIGYDEQYREYSPGRFHMQILLDRLLKSDSSVKELNLMSDASWHSGWNPEQIPLHTAYVPGGRTIGKLYVLVMKLVQACFSPDYPDTR